MGFEFLFSYFFILVAIFYSKKEGLGLEKELFVASLRTFFQLVLLGFFLSFVFEMTNPFFVAAIILFMLFFGAYEGFKRVKIDGGFWISLAVLGIVYCSVFGLLVLSGIVSIKPSELIPISGMIIGNALNAYAVAIDRFKGEVKNSYGVIEQYIALGLSLKQSVQDAKIFSLKASMIPIFNSLRSVGIIFIPGMATGMMVAGANPATAIGYQIAILYMVATVTILSAELGIAFSYKKILIRT